MSRLRIFLLGVLAGATLAGSVYVSIEIYRSIDVRIRALEGYVQMLEYMRRGGR